MFAVCTTGGRDDRSSTACAASGLRNSGPHADAADAPSTDTITRNATRVEVSAHGTGDAAGRAEAAAPRPAAAETASRLRLRLHRGRGDRTDATLADAHLATGTRSRKRRLSQRGRRARWPDAAKAGAGHFARTNLALGDVVEVLARLPVQRNESAWRDRVGVGWSRLPEDHGRQGDEHQKACELRHVGPPLRQIQGRRLEERAHVNVGRATEERHGCAYRGARRLTPMLILMRTRAR